MIAIISDIHGNYPAFQAVLDDIQDQNVNKYWVLGDVVGYGHMPKRVLDELHELKQASKIEDGTWLAGNHDWGLVGLAYPGKGISPQGFNDLAKVALRKQHELLNRFEEAKRYIKQLGELPFLNQVRDNVFIAHGAYLPDTVQTSYFATESPYYGVRRYVPDEMDIEQDFFANHDQWGKIIKTAPVLSFYGHTHKPRFFERVIDNPPPEHYEQVLDVTPAKAKVFWTNHPIEYGVWKPLTTKTVYNINVGSVGFPRDEKYPCPTYVLLDETEEGYRIQFRRVIYDVEATRAEMKKAGVESGIYDRYLLDCKAD